MLPSRHHVLAHRQLHLDRRGHRLDAIDIHFVELLDPRQDAVQLPGHRLQPLLGNRNPRQPRHLANRVLVDAHVQTLNWGKIRSRLP